MATILQFLGNWDVLNQKANAGTLSPEEIEYLKNANAGPGGSTYVSGVNVPITALTTQLATMGTSVEDMMRARDATNGGTPFAYDPENNAWDAGTQAAIQTAVRLAGGAQNNQATTTTTGQGDLSGNTVGGGAPLDAVPAVSGDHGSSSLWSTYGIYILAGLAALILLAFANKAGSRIPGGAAHGV